MRRSPTRCDQIIALIDQCLADYELARLPMAPSSGGAKPREARLRLARQ